MVWLYSVSDLHKKWSMDSLHQWTIPALRHQQYRLYRSGDKPVGFATWAWLSEDIETIYATNPSSLKPRDWQSGERLWILDLVAPFGDAKRVIADLRRNVFPNDVGRFLRAKKGEDVLRIMYVHGYDAVEKARDRERNPNVRLTNKQIR